MYAQGSKRYGNPAAVAGDNFTIRDQRADLPCHRIWIGEDGTRFGSRQQRAIHRVPPVGKGFRRKGVSYRSRRVFHGGSGATYQAQDWIKYANTRDDRDRQRAVGLRLVVQRTMRLDVAQRSAVGAGDGIQRTKLSASSVCASPSPTSAFRSSCRTREILSGLRQFEGCRLVFGRDLAGLEDAPPEREGSGHAAEGGCGR